MGAGDEIPSLHGLYYLILLGKPLGPPILKFSNQSTKKQGQSQKHRSNCRPSNPSILGHVQSWSTELSGLIHFSVFKIPILDLPNMFSRNLGTILGSNLIRSEKNERHPKKRIKKDIQPARIGPGHLIASLAAGSSRLQWPVTGKVRISPSVTSFYHWHIVHMKSIEIPNLIHENGTDEFFMPWDENLLPALRKEKATMLCFFGSRINGNGHKLRHLLHVAVFNRPYASWAVQVSMFVSSFSDHVLLIKNQKLMV